MIDELDIIEAIAIDNENEDKNTTQLENLETIQLDTGYERESREECWENLRQNQELRHEMHNHGEEW